MIIETDRLRLRPFALEDVDAIHRLWIEPGVRKFLWDDEVIQRETAESVINNSIASYQKDRSGLWAVYPRQEDTLIGFCGYHLFHEPPQLELLYGIATSHWGMGLASEAARAMIKYGFEVLSFDRIVASTDAPNLASVRVMEKAGMSYYKREVTNGLDTIYYTITKEAFCD